MKLVVNKSIVVNGNNEMFAICGSGRDVCDRLFLEAMESDGVSWIKRNLMYNAVRAFGWTVWKGYEKAEVDEYKKYLTVIVKGE